MTQSGKMNFGPEDQQRQVSGGALIALTVGAMVFSESARGSYGTCAVALSAGLVQWRTGESEARIDSSSYARVGGASRRVSLLPLSWNPR